MFSRERRIRGIFSEFKKEAFECLAYWYGESDAHNIFRRDKSYFDSIEKMVFNSDSGTYLLEQAKLGILSFEHHPSEDISYFSFLITAAYINSVYNCDSKLTYNVFETIENLDKRARDCFLTFHGWRLAQASIIIGDIQDEFLRYSQDADAQCKCVMIIDAVFAAMMSGTQKMRDYMADYIKEQGFEFERTWICLASAVHGLVFNMIEDGAQAEDIEMVFHKDRLLNLVSLDTPWEATVAAGALIYGRTDVAELIESIYYDSGSYPYGDDFRYAVLSFFYPMSELSSNKKDISEFVDFFEKKGTDKNNILTVYGSYGEYAKHYGYEKEPVCPDVFAYRMEHLLPCIDRTFAKAYREYLEEKEEKNIEK